MASTLIHHQGQLDRVALVVEDVAVGPFDLFEERQELLVTVSLLERGGQIDHAWSYWHSPDNSVLGQCVHFESDRMWVSSTTQGQMIGIEYTVINGPANLRHLTRPDQLSL